MNDKNTMKKKATNRKYILWLVPSFTGTLVFWLLPFFRLLRLSVTKNNHTIFVGLEHFVSVLHNESFRLAVNNTLQFMIICIPLLWGLSFIFAVLLSKSSLLNMWIKEGLLYPFVLPTTAVLLLYQVSFGEKGWINQLLHCQEDWFNGKYAMLILVVLYIWKYIGLYTFIWLSGIINTKTVWREQAMLDGASLFQYAWYILAPNLRLTCFICFVFIMINIFKVFRELYLITGNYPSENIYMLQHIFNNWFLNYSYSKLSAAAVLVAIFVLIIIGIVYGIIIRKDENA